jgi:hypothetical protein
MKTVVNVKVAELKLHKSYSKIYSVKNRQLEILIDSIKQTDGILTPIVINKRKEIINGVQRWLAYKELGKKLIPATTLDDTNADREVLCMISYNRHKDKTMLERWQEIKTLKVLFGKRQGERTDLKPDGDATSTRKKIAMSMHISEGNVYKLEKVAETSLTLLPLVDTKEISLHEAYERALKMTGKKISTKKSESKNGEKPIEVEDCKCPKCGHEFINK